MAPAIRAPRRDEDLRPSSKTLTRSMSIDCLQARRSRLAMQIDDIRVTAEQQAFVNRPSLPVHEARAQQEEINLVMDARHADLVARARQLEFITADAIKSSQERTTAARVTRWERLGFYYSEVGHVVAVNDSTMASTSMWEPGTSALSAASARAAVPALPASWVGGASGGVSTATAHAVLLSDKTETMPGGHAMANYTSARPAPLGEEGLVALKARRERLAREVLMLRFDGHQQFMSPVGKAVDRWGVFALPDSA